MNHRTRALLITSTLVAAIGAPADPATASSSKATYYLSLGDSLAESAQPIGGLTSGYSEAVYKAVRNDHQQLQHVKLGCGGETTGSMIDTTQAGSCRYPGNQLDVAVEFITAHPSQIALITIDIGANDTFACLDPTTFLFDQSCVDHVVPSTLANLAAILASLQAAAPDVPVVGMDYYDVFLGLWVFGADGQAAALHNAPIVDAVNASLVTVYEAAGFRVADVAGAFDNSNFADTVATSQWGVIPVNVANVCAWTWFCDDKYTFDVHANTDGYQVIAKAFLNVLA